MTMLHDGRDLRIQVWSQGDNSYQLILESGYISLDNNVFSCNIKADSILQADRIALAIGRDFHDSGMSSIQYREYFRSNREEIINDA